MPYKHRLKQHGTTPKKKARYYIENASAYNKSLKKRGELSCYFPAGDLKTQLVNLAPYVEGVSGQ